MGYNFVSLRGHPFMEPLKKTLQMATEYGLIDEWFKHGLIKVTYLSDLLKPTHPLSLKELAHIFIGLLVGLSFALIVFVIELHVKKCKKVGRKWFKNSRLRRRKQIMLIFPSRLLRYIRGPGKERHTTIQTRSKNWL